MAFTFNDIIYHKSDAVARITINRPETYNAFTDITLREMNQALDDAGSDGDIGVVVITGSGRNAFCSGGDVFWESQGGLERIPFNINDRIGQCPKPVIARVNGYAVGAGNHMAYHCDFTIAAEHAIFGQNGARVGSPASGETVSFLSHVVGHKRAREMWFLCRRYTAQQAYEWGLANAVVPYGRLDEEVNRWCRDLLALSPTCLKVLKASFEAEADYLRGSGDRIRRMVAPNYYRTGEQQEGAAAFLERRPPDFSPWR
ncbi:MAG: enoyl-CoA hydratase-related protein [bacterium]|nr:enoyl-CoA hydratase-related protein [bacterium]